MRLSASTIYTLYSPSPCELRPWLVAHDTPCMEPGPFEQMLVRLGQRHERDHLMQLGPFTDLSEGELAERAEATRQHIERRTPVLYQPVLTTSAMLNGEETQIVGVPDFLILDEPSYRIRDCKLARHADEEAHPEILRQAELYGWLFEKVTGAPPRAIEVVLGDSSIVDIPYDSGARVLSLLAELSRTTREEAAPYSPIGWSKCQGCGFRSRCWSEAAASQDVALVYGVDQGLARGLREIGVTSMRELRDRFDEPSLSEFRRPWGDRERKVGTAAGRILQQADAMLAERAIQLGRPALPEAGNYVMFDVEGMPPFLDELDKVYLWGTQVYGREPGEYHADLASFGPEGDRDAWLQFLDHCRGLFDRYGDIPFIHWASYEMVKIRAYIDRHGDTDEIARRVLDCCVDLLPITRSAVVLPQPSYSLKVVEQHVGYERKLEEYGGDWSMAKFIEATETGDDAERRAIMDEVIAYNREDLEATRAVFQWISSLP